MASKKDLVEAHQFSRRRLVSAFLSGAPGGREVEPPRPGRTVFGGVVLAVLLIAGGAVAHFLSPKAATDWAKQDGLVVTKGGSRYVVVGPDGKKEIRPVVNLTSAQLILGLDLEDKSKVIDQDEIAKKRPGDTIGISSANVPEELPTKDEFINTGWTACTDDGDGTYVNISEKPDVKSGATSGFLVKTSKSTYLIAEGVGEDGRTQAYSYDLQGNQSTFEAQIFNAGTSPTTMTVPQSWVDLFPVGTPIGYAGFGITDAGKPYSGSNAGGNFTVGSITNFNQQDFVLTDKGWAYLNPFASNVYTTAASLEQHPAPHVTLSGAPAVTGELKKTTWPAKKPEPASDAACAELVAPNTKTKPYVTLGVTPGTRAWPSTPPATDSAPTGLVDPGKGAFVYVGSGPDSSSGVPFLIDSGGHTNKIDGDTTVAKLGLTNRSGPVIPAPWLLLLPQGTALSTEMALCPPTTSKIEDQRCVSTQQ